MLADTLGHAAQLLIIGLGFFVVGTTLYLGLFVNLREAISQRDPWQLAYASARVGVGVMVALITEAVFKAPTIPLTWRVALYILASLMVSVGYLFVAYDHKRTGAP